MIELSPPLFTSETFKPNRLPSKCTDPIIIEHDIPIPKGREGGFKYQLKCAFLEMKPGDSFMWYRDNKHCYSVAKTVDVKIRTMKVSGKGYRVWRVS